jgi:hypothetical protein
LDTTPAASGSLGELFQQMACRLRTACFHDANARAGLGGFALRDMHRIVAVGTRDDDDEVGPMNERGQALGAIPLGPAVVDLHLDAEIRTAGDKLTLNPVMATDERDMLIALTHCTAEEEEEERTRDQNWTPTRTCTSLSVWSESRALSSTPFAKSCPGATAR